MLGEGNSGEDLTSPSLTQMMPWRKHSFSGREKDLLEWQPSAAAGVAGKWERDGGSPLGRSLKESCLTRGGGRLREAASSGNATAEEF